MRPALHETHEDSVKFFLRQWFRGFFNFETLKGFVRRISKEKLEK